MFRVKRRPRLYADHLLYMPPNKWLEKDLWTRSRGSHAVASQPLRQAETPVFKRTLMTIRQVTVRSGARKEGL